MVALTLNFFVETDSDFTGWPVARSRSTMPVSATCMAGELVVPSDSMTVSANSGSVAVESTRRVMRTEAMESAVIRSTMASFVETVPRVPEVVKLPTGASV